MKIQPAVLAALCCIGGVALCAERAAPDGLMPAETLLAVQLQRPAEFWQALSGSELLRAVEADPAAKSWLGFAEAIAVGTARSHAGIDLGEFVRTYAARATLAVIDLPRHSGAVPWVVVIDPPPDARENGLKELLSKTIEPALIRRNPTFKIESGQFAGRTVRSVVQPDGSVPLSYCIADRALLMGRSRAVEAACAPTRTLAEVPAYKRCRDAAAAGAGVQVFLNVRKLLDANEKQWRSADGPWKLAAGAGIRSIEAVMACSRLDGGLFRDKVVIDTPCGRAGLLRLLESSVRGSERHAVPRWADVLPSDIIAVAGGRLRDGAEMWEILSRNAEDVDRGWAVERRADGAEQMRTPFGINLPRKGLEALGGEYFVAWLNGGDWREKLVFGAQVRDAARLQEELKQLLMSQSRLGKGVRIEMKRHGDVDVYSIVVPGRSVRPGFAIAKDCFLLASVHETVYSIIDADERLSDNRRFKQAVASLPRRSAVVAYAEPALLGRVLVRGDKQRALVNAVTRELSPFVMGLWAEGGSIRGSGSSPAGGPVFGLTAAFWLKLLPAAGARP